MPLSHVFAYSMNLPHKVGLLNNVENLGYVADPYAPFREARYSGIPAQILIKTKRGETCRLQIKGKRF
jgi:hypothetical protein